MPIYGGATLSPRLRFATLSGGGGPVTPAIVAPSYSMFDLAAGDMGSWAADGGNMAVTIAIWDQLQPSATGTVDSTALAALNATIDAAAAAGLSVHLRFAPQYSPAWVFSTAPRFKDQDGNSWTGSGVNGNELPDLVWSATARALFSDFVTRVYNGITTKSAITEIGVGGGPYGELQYPPVGGAPYRFWCYSTPAKSGGADLAAGMTALTSTGLTATFAPTWSGSGYPSGGDANHQTFRAWYVGSLTAFLNWQIALIRSLGYTGAFYVLHPSYGLRETWPNIGTSYWEAIAQGQDWGAHIAAYAADPLVWPWSTWIDSNDEAWYSGTGYATQSDDSLAPPRKLYKVAAGYTKTEFIKGENTSVAITPAVIRRTLLTPNYPFAYGYVGYTHLNWGSLTAEQEAALRDATAGTEQWYGVNLAGGEFGDDTLPGTLDSNYTYPADADINAYFAGKGQTLLRLPVRWERVQPTQLGALSSADVTAITDALDAADAAGCKVILDLHNYARWNPVGAGGGNGGTVGRLTTADAAKLNDVWTKLVTEFRTHPAIWGWELMNEPNGLTAEAGTFTGGVRYAWATTTQGWAGGDVNHTLTFDGAEGHAATGALKVVKTNSGTTNMNLRVDDAGQKLGTASGNVFSVWVKLAAGTTGTWTARVEWQTAAFAWQANGATSYYSTTGTTLSGLVAGSWVEVRTDFTGNPPTSPNAFLVHVESNNPPASNITIWIDDFAQGSAAGSYTERGVWAYLADQAAVAVEAVDTAHWIIVPGYVWEHAQDWTANNPGFPLANPSGKRVYGAHTYWDANRSGQYNGSYTAEGGTPTKGTAEVTEFLDWLTAHDQLGVFTEYGVPGNDSRWLVTLQDFYATIAAHPNVLGATYWAAGPWWGSYPLSVQPGGSVGAYTDKPQMAVLQDYRTG